MLSLALIVTLAGCSPFTKKAAFGFVPDGLISSLVSQHGDFYFAFEPLYSSNGAQELWRAELDGDADPVSFERGCVPGEIRAVAPHPDGRLTIAMDCSWSREVINLDPTSLDVELVARFAGDGDYLPAISRLVWIGDRLLISSDTYFCTGIARIDDDVAVPIGPLVVDGAVLELGASYERRPGDCQDLPLAGFVTGAGDSVALLVSRDAVGVETDARSDVEWSLLRTTREWKAGVEIVADVRRPQAIAAYGGCVVLAADLSSVGIWLVSADGRTVDKVASGTYVDLAVEPQTGAVAVLGDSRQPESLEIIQLDEQQRQNCLAQESSSTLVPRGARLAQ